MKPVLTLLLLLSVVALPLLAHDDDPKALQGNLPYAGPGWRPGNPTLGGGPMASGTFTSDGVALLSWMSPADLGLGLGANDCWGYVSPSGREYAILCSEESTEFVEVTDPQDPQHLGGVPGPVGLWRDAKTYGEFCYSVHETDGVGIQVIDLSQIDAGTVTLVNTVEGTDSGHTHNVAIDEQAGYLYRTGGAGHGLRIYDLADPANPQWVSTWDDRYVHDAQVVTWSDGRELAFCCGGFNNGWDDTGLTILDVSDKLNITVVAQLYHFPKEYAHQGWLSEDRQYFYLGDELDEDGTNFTSTHVFDVGDPDNGFYVGFFTNASYSIGHNMYTHGGRLYEANYESGLRIFDTTANPTSPPEVAWFDTHPTVDTADFGGSWSNYPYLPGGVVLLSDRELGLFVLRPDGPLGVTYCSPAAVNSTGLPGTIAAAGSPRVAEGRVTATATQLPPGEPAILLAGPMRGGAVLPGGGRIGLCVGAPFGLFRATAGTVDGSGSIAFPVDLTSVPTGSGGTTAVQPGDTWYLQVSYMDGGQSLFTDALGITFE